eukprot:m.268733 g.268733  ORF g.268733 m.268733 type:complete len:319 (-) comp80139_c0_seq1:380-1336(-)
MALSPNVQCLVVGAVLGCVFVVATTDFHKPPTPAIRMYMRPVRLAMLENRTSQSKTVSRCDPAATSSPENTISIADNTHHPTQLFPSECILDPSISKAFDSIYIHGIWAKHRPLASPSHYYTYGNISLLERYSSSGDGSDIGIRTQGSLEMISKAINDNGIQSMLDIPCGDVNWQFESWEIDSLPVYVGGDVALVVVALNSKRFAHHTNKRFVTWDLTTCDFPMFKNISTQEFQPFDLIHIRDVIQHLPLQKGADIIKRVKAAGAKYLATTTYTNGRNGNVKTGSFYKNDLSAPPFSMNAPLICTPSIYGKQQCVYKL